MCQTDADMEALISQLTYTANDNDNNLGES